MDNAIDNSALTAVYFPVKSDCASGFPSLRVDTKKGKKEEKSTEFLHLQQYTVLYNKRSENISFARPPIRGAGFREIERYRKTKRKRSV